MTSIQIRRAPARRIFFAPTSRDKTQPPTRGHEKTRLKKVFSLQLTNLKKSSYICTRLGEGSFCTYIAHYQSQIFD